MTGFLIAVLSGTLMSVQGVFNTQVTKTAGMWVSNGWVQFSAFIICLIAWLVTGRNPVGAVSYTHLTQFLGAAPEAILGIVKLKEAKNYLRDFYLIREDAVCYQENDIMAGLKYLNDLAENEGLPLVQMCIRDSHFPAKKSGHTDPTRVPETCPE